MPDRAHESNADTIAGRLRCPLCDASYLGGEAAFCSHDGARLRASDGHTSGWIERNIDDKYRLLRLIGRGGTAEVYEAEHIHLGRRLALKFLHPWLAADPAMAQRFQQEAKLISRLAHPNVVAVEDFGALADGTLYMAMELLEGQSLADALDGGGVSVRTALDVAIQACEGLAAAHDNGVVHRDVKPANLFLQRVNEPGGRVGTVVKILDLGLAKLYQETSSNLTITGGIFGTPEYMSPEQAMGDSVGPCADIYSLGVTLYELLIGRVPFSGSSFMAVLNRQVCEAPDWPRDIAEARGVPAEAERIVAKALAKDPDQRFTSIREFQEVLVELLERIADVPSLRPGSKPHEATGARGRRSPSTFSRVSLISAQGGDDEVVEIAPDVYWVARRHGATLECNTYLRIYRGEGRRTALLIDPGPPKDLEVISAKVEALIGSLEAVDLMFLNHQDPDLASNAAAIQARNPRAHVVCSEDTWRLAQFYGLNRRSYSATEHFPNQQLRLATGHRLRFVPTPYCHFRGAVALYDLATRVLFSGDLAGGIARGTRLMATDADWPGVALFHQIYMPSQKALASAVASIKRLEPAPLYIAPQHGAVISGERMASWLDDLERLSVGADLLVEGDLKQKYLAVLGDLIATLDGMLGEAGAARLLRRHSRDGTFSNLFVFSEPLRVVDFKVPPQIALRALVQSLSEAVTASEFVEFDAVLRAALDRQGLGASYDAEGI